MTPASLIRCLLDANRVVPGEKVEERKLSRDLEALGEELERHGIALGADSKLAHRLGEQLSHAVALTEATIDIANRVDDKFMTEGLIQDVCPKAAKGKPKWNPTSSISAGLARVPEIFEAQLAHSDRIAQEVATLGEGVAATGREVRAKKRT